MNYPHLEHFLSSYLSAEQSSNLSVAVRAYSSKEGQSALQALRQELKSLLASGDPTADLQSLFDTAGHFSLRADTNAARGLLIDLFEHVQAVSLPPSDEKPYDVFISHSSSDKVVATRLAVALKDRGYAVWLDDWEILVGHDIVDAVYRGITESEFLVVLLSSASCRSRWVQEELAAAKISEIERRQVTILPVVVEPCDIPATLKNKRHANFAQSWEEGLRQLTTAIDLHRATAGLRRPTTESLPPDNFQLLDGLRTELLPAILKAGFAEDMAFQDVVIGPPDHVQIAIDRTRLTSLVEACRVQLRGWGGPAFPYESYPGTQEVRLADGVRYVDSSPWPYTTRSFHFWQVNTQLRLFHRQDLKEDNDLDASGQAFVAGKLARTWILIEIVTPLMFARNLLRHEKRLGVLAVKFVWGGLRDRTLVEINPRRWRFHRDYRCHETEWNHQSVVHLDSDLLVEARKASLALFWLFGWEPKGDILDRDLQTLLSGSAER